MAGEIDNINFKVILDDIEFDERIKRDLATAKAFNTTVSQLLNVKKQAAAADSRAAINAEKLAKAVAQREEAEKKAAGTAQREAQKTAAAGVAAQQRIQREIEKTGSMSRINAEKESQAILKTQIAQERLNRLKQEGNTIGLGQNKLLRELGSYAAAYFSVRTVERFISSLVRVSGEFELQQTTLRAILQDVDGADKIFNQLQVLAVKSPFSFSDLTSYAKQLSAFSVPMEELCDTTKMLADVSAGLGVDMSRIILAYGQIRSAAFLRGQEVRQLTEAGIPILAELAKQFEEIEGRVVSVGEVFDKISAREVPFEMVEKVFKDMTSEGGKFFNMQEVQAETLKAKVKNLGDQYDIMLYQIGQAQDGLLKGTVSAIGGLMEHWQAIGRVIVSVASGFGAYAAVLAVVAMRKKVLLAMDAISVIMRQTRVTGSLTNAIKLYVAGLEQAGKASKAAFAGSLIGIITAIAVAIYQVVRAAGELNRELDKLAAEKFTEMQRSLDGFDDLVTKLQRATEGSQDYRYAIHDLNSKYGEYLPNLLTEKNAYDEIARSADAARAAIQRKAYASARASGMEKIDDKYGNAYSEAVQRLAKELSFAATLNGQKLTDKQALAFAQFYGKNYRNYSGSYTDAYGFQDAAKDFFGTSLGTPNGNFAPRGNSTVWLNNLRNFSGKYHDSISQLDSRLQILHFGGDIETEAEREGLQAIEDRYEMRIAYLKTLKKTADEYNQSLQQIENMRLLEKEELYQSLNMPEKARKYTSAITSKNAPATGSLRLIRDVLAANGIASKNDLNWGLWADESTNIDEYLDDLSKRYKEVSSGITKHQAAFKAMAHTAFDIADYEKLNDESKHEYDILANLYRQQKIISELGQMFNVNVTGKTSSGSGSSKEDPRLTALKDEQKTIENIRKVYEQFRPFLNEDNVTMKANLRRLFPDADEQLLETLDFDAALRRLANDMEKYGDAGKKAANAIRTALEVKAVHDAADATLQNYKDSATALEKVDAMLKKILETTRDLGGERLGLAVSRVVDELRIKNNGVDAEDDSRIKTIAAGELEYVELHGREAWEKYRDNALKAVNAWASAEKKANHDIAQDRIKSLGNNFIQTFLKDNNKNIQRLDKKSLKELESILLLLKSGLSDEKLLEFIDPKVIERAKELGLTVDEILDAIKEARDETSDTVLDKKLEKIKTLLNELGKSLESLGDSISALGDISEDSWKGFDWIGGAISGLGKLASGYGKVLELSKKGKTEQIAGYASMVIENIGNIVSMVGSQIEENKRKQEEWKLTVLETELAYRSLMIDKLDYKESNVFGVDDPLKRARDGVNQYKEAATELLGMQSKLENGKVQVGTKKVASGKNTAIGAASGALAGVGTAALIGAAVGTAAGPIGTAIGAGIGLIVGGLVGLFGAKKTVAVYNTLLDKYGTILDETEGAEPFALNPEIIANYKKLDDETKLLVDHWQEVREKILQIEEDLNNSIEEWAGDIGSQLRDALVEAFRNNDLYSAIDNFHDYVTTILEDLIAQTVFAAVFEDSFKQLQQDLHDSVYAPEKVGYKSWEQILAEFGNGVEDKAKLVFDMLSDAQAWGEGFGYKLFANKDGDSALGNGIKSITEDTANLLASYLNAIRADVSVMRIAQAQGWLDVKGILSRMPSPTVWEYIAKIEAHTFDIAQTNAEIAQSNAAMLSELRSVITTSGGSPAVAAYMQ